MSGREVMSIMMENLRRLARHKYIDQLIVFSVMLTFGVFLVISASGQMDSQPAYLVGLSMDKSSPQEIGAIVRWTAEAGDPDGDQVSYRFILRELKGGSARGKELGDTDWNASPNWTWDTSRMGSGRYSIEVQVRDGNNDPGDAFDDSRTIEFELIEPPTPAGQEEVAPAVVPEVPKPNMAPTAVSLQANSASPQNAGAAVTWTAMAEDPDGDQIEFLFLMDGQVVRDWSAQGSWTWQTNDNDAGVHAFEVRARDGMHNQNGDAADQADFEIVKPNVPPTTVSLQPDQTSPQNAGAAVTWTAMAEDPDGDQVEYMFLLDGTVVQDWSTGNSWTWQTADAQPGEHVVWVKVRDGLHDMNGDASDEDAFVIEAAPVVEEVPAAAEVPQTEPAAQNQTPVITSLSVEPASPQVAGTNITWTAEAADTDGDQIEFMFMLDSQLVQDWSTGNSWTWQTADAQPGEHVVSVKVRDGLHDMNGDASDEDAFVIEAAPVIVEQKPAEEEQPAAEMAENSTPLAEALTAEPAGSASAGTSVVWMALASDPDNDPLQYAFFLDGQLVQDWSEDSTWSWNTTDSDVGSHSAEVKVRDGLHNSEGDSTAAAQFTVEQAAAVEEEPEPVAQNSAPQIDSLNADPASPSPAGTNVTWTVMASDAEQDTMEFRFSLDGQIVQDWSGESTWTWNTESAFLGTHLIEAGVRDGEHATNGSADATRSGEYVVEAKPEAVSEEAVPGPVAEVKRNVSGYVFHDLDGNGAMDPGEQGLAGWTVTLSGLDVSGAEATTGPDGAYLAGDLDSGNYSAQVAVKAGWTITTAESLPVDLTASDVTAVNFGVKARKYSISGTKFNDQNGNGQSDGEPGLSGWKIYLSKPDATEEETATDQQGSYSFADLVPGNYTVREEFRAGWKAVTPTTRSVTISDAEVTGVDFGNQEIGFTLSGRVFDDLDGDGASEGEPGIEGAEVLLSGPKEASATTAADGSYRFDNLTAGTYKVSYSEQEGWTRTVPKEGYYSVEIKDSNVAGKDFGSYGALAISGTVFADKNGDFAKNADEKGLAGWVIKLERDGNVTAAATTAADGSYKFSKLAPGPYSLTAVPQEGWSVQQPSQAVNLQSGDATGIDFPAKGNLTISGIKYYDLNANGVQDADEPGIPESSVTLLEGNVELQTVTTDRDGKYTFTGVVPGTYSLRDPPPAGFTMTTSSTITVTVSTSVVVGANFGLVGSYSISGRKWNDINGNGLQDAGEPGIPGWGVILDGTTAWEGLPVTMSTTTGPNGDYTFQWVAPGSYKVSELAKAGWTPTYPTPNTEHQVVILGSSVSGKNFGNRAVPPAGTGSIWGFKFHDLNKDGVYQSGEPTLAGWTIQLGGAATATTVTDVNGWYNFSGLAPGTYTVSEVQKAGWTRTKPASGTYTLNLLAGQSLTGNSFGNYLPAPSGANLAAAPASPQNVGVPVVWTATASTSAPPLQYNFWMRGPATGGIWIEVRPWSSSNQWTWNTAELLPGNYDVRVDIKDSLQSTISVIKPYTLKSTNLPPVVQFIYTDRPSPQFAGSWVRWTAVAWDPEGDPIQYKFLLRGPRTGYIWKDMTGWASNAKSWTWKTNPSDLGESEVMVYVRDGKHAPPSGYDDRDIGDFLILGYIPVQPNMPPVLTGFGASLPSPQYSGSKVTWSASAYDPDGNPVYYRYWLKGPASNNRWIMVRDWSISNTWTWTTTAADIGLSQVAVHVRDGLHANLGSWDDELASAFSVIAKPLPPNRPPVLTSLASDKASPQNAGGSIKWTATATDPDRDPILYRFWLKGPATGDAWAIVRDWSTSNSWTWTSAPSDAGDYSVFVYARDGKHAPATGYDSYKGQLYQLKVPMVALTTGNIARDVPRLIYTDKGYLLAYQSWEKGKVYQGDIQMVAYDQAFKALKNTWATQEKVYQDYPSLLFSDGFYYLAYVSGERGNLDIFMKKFDQSFRLLETRALTTSRLDQDSPSLIRVGDDFVLAYQSWDRGKSYSGDIYVTRFNSTWSPVKTALVVGNRTYEDRPSMAFASGNFYLAYSGQVGDNLDIFVAKLDQNLRLLDNRRITTDRSDQEMPFLLWNNGEFILTYATTSSGNYDLVMERFLRDWKRIEKRNVVSAAGDQTWPSMTYNPTSGLYWLAYLNKDATSSNIYALPLKLTNSLRPCSISAGFSAARANQPFVMEAKFSNNYGELTDPSGIRVSWSPSDAARPGASLKKVSTGVYRLTSTFGARGDKVFNIAAKIDGCYSEKSFPVKVS